LPSKRLGFIAQFAFAASALQVDFVRSTRRLVEPVKTIFADGIGGGHQG
jgi:hypothetical protein